MNNKERAINLRKEHVRWRESNFISKVGFFPVFTGFEYYLSKVSTGAISLFLYLGLHSNNKTGECYHDLGRIADFFGKTPRTITSWFKELEDIGLIERFQIQMNGVAHTFIRPYTQDTNNKK